MVTSSTVLAATSRAAPHRVMLRTDFSGSLSHLPGTHHTVLLVRSWHTMSWQLRSPRLLVGQGTGLTTCCSLAPVLMSLAVPVPWCKVFLCSNGSCCSQQAVQNPNRWTSKGEVVEETVTMVTTPHLQVLKPNTTQNTLIVCK